MLKKFLIGSITVFALAFALNVSAAVDLGPTTLKVGSSGQYVMNLQTIVGATADGKFGPMTKAKVMAWQSNNGLVADGLVGPATKNAMNAGSYTGTTATTCPVGQFDPMTGLACGAASTLPAGCLAGYAFSSTTGAACVAGTTTPVVTTTGQEGSLTVTYDAVPANNLSVLKGENKDVMAIKLKATGSDMNVSRLWLDIDKRIWLSADTATLSDGSTVIATMPLTAGTVTETTVGSAWQMQFNGLNVVVPVGTTKVLTLKINRPTLTQNSDSVAVATTSSVRATDGAGISTAYTMTARTINLSSTTAATTGTLTTSLNANSPAAQSIAGLSTTAGVLTPVKLADFDFKGEDAAINITQLVATLTSTGTVANEVGAVELRDGTSVLSSVSLSTGTATFPTLNIDIAKDTTKTLSIWAQMNPTGSTGAGYTTKGSGITATLDSSATVATDASFATVTVTSSDPVGKTQYMFQYAPTLTLGAVSAVQADESTSTTVYKGANYSIAFTVTAPTGSDIYVNTPDLKAVVAYNATTDGTSPIFASIGGTLVTGSTVSGVTSEGTTLSTYDKVAAGTSRTFTITGYIPHGGTAGYQGMHINGIEWNSVDSETGLTTQNWGLTDFKTPTVYVTI